MSKHHMISGMIAWASAASLMAAAGCATDELATDSKGYAERVYASYEEAAQGAIEIDVLARSAGRLDELVSMPLDQRLGVPDYWLRMDSVGTDIVAIHREARDAEVDEWSRPVDLGEFDALGQPVDEATYRLFEVTTRHEGVTSSHRALEVCWLAQESCLVMDPVILQVEGFYRDRQRLLAEGWAPVEEVEKLGGSCTLNSNPTATSRSIKHGAYWVEYLNIFGIVLVRKDMGGQQVGIACYVSGDKCMSSGFGYSNTSSCFANLGYTCDCDNTGNQIGTAADGSSTKSWSESKCAHRAFLSASASWTIEGVGSGFHINWDTAGSVDTIGGQLYDACSWH